MLTEEEIDLLTGVERRGMDGAQGEDADARPLRARHFLTGGEPLPGASSLPPRRAGLLPRTTVTVERL